MAGAGRGVGKMQVSGLVFPRGLVVHSLVLWYRLVYESI